MKFRTACQDRQAGKSAAKYLSQEHNIMVVIMLPPARRFNHSTMLPTFQSGLYKDFSPNIISCFEMF